MRRTYSAKFLPIAKFVPITLASLSCNICPAFAYASELEELVVTASPLDKNRDAVNQAVATLSGDQLHQAAASTLGETLNGLPGVSSASFGPGVGLPIIRGQSDNRVKVMQDSIGTMDASAASPDHSVTIEPLFAKRIEVLRGPAALRYGSGAIGGVVNVLDNRIPDELPDGIEAALELRHGSVNDANTAVGTLTGSIGNVALHWDGINHENGDLNIPGNAANQVDSPLETTHGFIANTDAESHSNSLGASYIGDMGFLGLSVNKLTNNYGIPPAANTLDSTGALEEEPELVRIDMNQTRYDLKGELNNPLSGIEKISLRAGHNDYQHTEMENGEPGTRFTNKAWEGRVEMVHQMIANWQGALGVQASDRTFAAIGDEAFIPKSDISNQGIFFVEETKRGAWTFELGARAEQQKIAPDTGASISHDTTNLSGSSVWHFTRNQRLSFGIAKSQRAPSVEELLANGPHPATESFLVGDADLDVETSNNIELGYHWHSKRFQASINAYYNQIDNFIYARATGAIEDDLAEYQYRQQDANFSGAELELTIPLADQWSLRLFGDSVNAKFDRATGANAYVPRIPPMRYGSALDFAKNNWKANLSMTHATAQDNPGANQTPTDAYTRMDANLSYTIDADSFNYLIFLKGTNLLNEEIRNSASFLREIAPEGGRGVQLGLRVSF
jgi:iron complex outermembrane recepter protein